MKKEEGSPDGFFPLAVGTLALALVWKLLPYLPAIFVGLGIGVLLGVTIRQDQKSKAVAALLGSLPNLTVITAVLYGFRFVSRSLLFVGLCSIPIGAVAIVFALWKSTSGKFGHRLGVALSFPCGILLEKRFQRFFLPKPEVDGFVVGTDSRGRPFRLTEKNLGYHVQVIAPTGSGKTNLLKNLLENRIRLGHGVVFLDYKGDSELLGWAKATAEEFGRAADFREVNLASPSQSIPYNPLSSGEPIELHSQLMNSMTWSEDFYRKVASSALLSLLSGLCEFRQKKGRPFHLGTIHDLLSDPKKLADFSSELLGIGADSSTAVSALSEELMKLSARENLLGLIANLHLIRASSAGKLFAKDRSKNAYALGAGLDCGDILFFLINSLKLKESASVLGRLILQDLMQQIGERYHRGGEHRPVTLVIDEFASFATPDFIEFMDRARGAGVGIVFAHQSRADLDAITPEFKSRIEANANTTILSGVRDPEDAEHFASMLGTQSTTKQTVQTNQLFGALSVETGLRSNREADEFLVHPNELKALNQGAVFVIARTVDPKHAILRVPQAAMRNQIERTIPNASSERRMPLLLLPPATQEHPEVCRAESPKAGGGFFN